MEIEIEVQMKVNMDVGKTGSEVASGWVEAGGCIKFPVRVRKYMDKKEQVEKMFVSYPQRKTEKGYENVLYPQDRQLRAEIEDKVLRGVRESLLRDTSQLPITETRVTLLDADRWDGKMKVRGIATVNIAGFAINGILIKEGKNGLFVQMPQHLSGDGNYRDTIYCTTGSMRWAVQDEVLAAYQHELSRVAGERLKVQKPEEDVPDFGTQKPKEDVPDFGTREKERNVPDSGTKRPEEDVPDSGTQEPERVQQEDVHRRTAMLLLMDAFDRQDIQEVASVLRRSRPEIELVDVAEDGTVRMQFASLSDEEGSLLLRYQYNPATGIRKIDGNLYMESPDQPTRSMVFYECSDVAEDQTEAVYKEMLGVWQKVTGQEPSGARTYETKKSMDPRTVSM